MFWRLFVHSCLVGNVTGEKHRCNSHIVTSAQATCLPEQKDIYHLIQRLRHEGNSGQLDDLSQIASLAYTVLAVF